MGTGVKGDVDGVETLLGRSPLDAVVVDVTTLSFVAGDFDQSGYSAA